MDATALALIDRAAAGGALSHDNVVFLLGFAPTSPEAAYAQAVATAAGRAAADGRGLLFGQIGLDAHPCPVNCAFCSLAAQFAQTGPDAPLELTDETLVESARALKDAGVAMISLMATAGLSIERTIAMAQIVRDAVGPALPLMANVGDITIEQARALKDAGFSAAYHARRIREGEITAVAPETRLETFKALSGAGLAIMAGVEPLYEGVNPEELADRILEIASFDPFCIGVCALTGAAGTAMADVRPASRTMVRFVAALVRLVCGNRATFGAVGGIRWIDAGNDPRSRGYEDHHAALLEAGTRAKASLTDDGWRVDDETLEAFFDRWNARRPQSTTSRHEEDDLSPDERRKTVNRPKARGRRPPHQPNPGAVIENPPIETVRASAASFVAIIDAREFGDVALQTPTRDDEKKSQRLTGSDGKPIARPLQELEGTPLLTRAVELVERCGFARAVVVIDAATPTTLRRAFEAALAGNDIAILPLDRGADQALAIEKHASEVFNLGYGLLEIALGEVEASGTRGALLLPADMIEIKPRHLKALIDELDAHPTTDVVASWITWFNRPPYLLSVEFLRKAAESGRETARSSSPSFIPLPRLNVREVVFGEEMLAATPPATDRVGRFFDHATLSALAACRFVRSERTDDHRKTTAQKAPSTVSEATPSAADRCIMDAARTVLARLDVALTERLTTTEQAELLRWNRWARRNRGDFPIFQDPRHRDSLVYLDTAATAQRLGSALEAARYFDAHENANIYRGAYPLSAAATATYNDARAQLESFIGARRGKTVFTGNTSQAAALVALNWGEHQIAAGDVIIVPASEHHSNLMPWMLLARRRGAELKTIPLRPDGRLDLDAFRTLLAEGGVRLVCIAHRSNVLGLVNPVREIADATHRTGARLFVDAAQSFGHLPIDVNELGADFIAFSAHKAYGPTGIGALWIVPEAFAEMDPLVAGGGTVSHVALDSYYLRVGAIQYELGTPSVSAAVGFAEAVRFIETLGFEAIAAHERTMTRYLLAGLEDFSGLSVLGDRSREDGLGGLVACSQVGLSAQSAATVLGKLGVCVRAGGHCALPLHANLGLTSSIRFSFGVYTTRKDIEAALVALEVCRRIYGVDCEPWSEEMR